MRSTAAHVRQYDRHVMRSVSYAAALALAYITLAATYIAVSGALAADTAQDLDELRRVELVKGVAFVAVTGGALFGLSLGMFLRLERSARSLAQAREALLAADRRATPGLLAASIAHDFNNALAVVTAGVDELRGLPLDATSQEIVADVAAATRRGTELARRLSRAGQGSASGEPRHTDVAAVAREAIELLRLHRKAGGRTLRVAAPQPVEIVAHPVLVHQLVTNLVLNALDAVSDKGTVIVRVAGTDDGAVVEVHDDGPGIPHAERPRLFDPFYTTKPDGTGLGLVSVRTCAELHGGSVDVADSVELGGACFRVFLRMPTGERAARAARL